MTEVLSMIELTPVLNSTSQTPLYVQLYEYIKQEIKVGTISSGTKLPSKRKLASYLKLGQNTVEAAYHQLMAEGYIESVSRTGFFVCNVQQNMLYSEQNTIERMTKRDTKPEKAYRFDFNHIGVDLHHFPYAVYRKLINEIVQPENAPFLLIGDVQGELSLRTEIARYLYQSRGVRCSPEQILLGSGTQHLLTLLCQLVTNKKFAMEDPGYHRVRVVLEGNGALLTPIPLDENGIDVSRLEQSSADVVYVTPSHQFPCGMVMPISRRMQLLRWAAQKEGRYIIEDDYDSEFRYTGKPIPSLQGLDTEEKVIYISTFSKALMPSLRVSYMVLPLPLLEHYRQSHALYTQTVSRLDQEILRKFMVNGYWDKHVNKMRILYRKKRDALVSSLLRFFPDNTEIIGQDSGLHILLRVNNGMSEEELLGKAAQKGIKVYPASIYYANQKSQHSSPMIVLGFATLTEEEIKAAVPLLYEAYFSASI